jgi:alpha-aminoadipic semialdehyde synthase
VFTGSGNVSQGGQEVFQELPHEYVPPDMLRKVAEHGCELLAYECLNVKKDKERKFYQHIKVSLLILNPKCN